MYPIDATRAGEAVFEYLRKWDLRLTSEVSDIAMDFRLDPDVDRLCVTIANDPDHPIDREPAALRAILSARITVFLANVARSPDTVLFHSPGPPTEESVLGAVFGLLLSKTRLPPEWNGKPPGGTPAAR